MMSSSDILCCFARYVILNWDLMLGILLKKLFDMVGTMDAAVVVRIMSDASCGFVGIIW
jgi:hypothetical protein